MLQRNKTLQSVVPLRQKIILVLLGLSLFFVLLEVGLRLGGLIFLSLQEYRNALSIRQKGEYRILCLGESTTAGQYPLFLTEALNRRNTGMGFSVIDKGRGATNTSIILSQIESYLNEYYPDAVVTMMGMNDKGVRYYQDISEVNTWIFRHCRVYRFGRMIYMHILKKIKKEDIYGLNRLEPGLSSKGNKKSSRLRSSYLDRSRSSEVEESLRETIEPNLKNDDAYFALMWFYRNQGKSSQAEDLLKKAIELNPKNDAAYLELGRFYRDQGKSSQAECSFKKYIELNSQNEGAYLELGQFYQYQNKFSEAEGSFKKAIELNPKSDAAYGALLILYEETGKPELAEEYAKKANAARLGYYNPVTVNNYHKLKKILDKRGIRLVCVQYPMRSIEPLKKIFEGNEQGIIFVDNEKIFRDAVRKDGPRTYFRDMFAGDFGHCTERGNRLLAENIASAILKEVFGK